MAKGKRADEPIRTCVGCREEAPQGGLTRFIREPDAGNLLIDLRHKLPGRGAYVHLRHACVSKALDRKAFNRVFKAPVVAEGADALMGRMVDAASRRLLERLGLARRAGALAVGSEPSRRAMRHDEARVVCLASDASEGTHRQISSNCQRKSIPCIDRFDGAALGRAVGEDYVAAVAVTADQFASEFRALSGPLAELDRVS